MLPVIVLLNDRRVYRLETGGYGDRPDINLNVLLPVIEFDRTDSAHLFAKTAFHAFFHINNVCLWDRLRKRQCDRILRTLLCTPAA